MGELSLRLITDAKRTPQRAWLGEVSAVVLQQALADAGKLRLPKIGDVKVRWSRDLPSEPSSVTVTVDAASRYHASFVVERPRRTTLGGRP